MSMVFKGGPDGIFEQINGLFPSKPLPIPLGLQRQDAARDLPVEAADSEVVPTQIRPSGYESMPWILGQVRSFLEMQGQTWQRKMPFRNDFII